MYANTTGTAMGTRQIKTVQSKILLQHLQCKIITFTKTQATIAGQLDKQNRSVYMRHFHLLCRLSAVWHSSFSTSSLLSSQEMSGLSSRVGCMVGSGRPDSEVSFLAQASHSILLSGRQSTSRCINVSTLPHLWQSGDSSSP